jgi:hypothetical protein
MSLPDSGLGPSGLIELVLAALLVALALAWRRSVIVRAERLAQNTFWTMALLAALPVVLRLCLLTHHPVPTSEIYDEFSHLLEADTLRHFRLANPPHALSQFFETFFVLQQPTYSSIYPPGQALPLALGWMLFGLPWAGVVLATAAFCALVYWMLRGWVSPSWALAGGVLAVVEFGPLNQWMNDYWGGAFIAMSGCLVFGALPRLTLKVRRRDAALLGLGLALNLVTRPYESIYLFLAAGAYFLLPGAPRKAASLRSLAKLLPLTGAFVLAAAGLLLVQNKQVTGSWTTMPEMLSQYQYGVPSAFTFQPNPVPHYPLTPQQAMDYKMQLSFHGSRTDTLRSFLLRLEYRVRYYRFFFLAPLYLALAAFLWRLRDPRYLWVAGTLVLFAIGTNFFPAFQLHYVAAVTCLFVLVSVAGLERIHRWLPEAAHWIVILCLAQFAFWYGIHAFCEGASWAPAVLRFETWDMVTHRNSRHAVVNRALDQVPGKLLVFVRYTPQHIFQDEWVYNRADIDQSRIVWARDLGDEEDRQLRAYYPDRTVLLLEPDSRPPELSRMPN